MSRIEETKVKVYEIMKDFINNPENRLNYDAELLNDDTEIEELGMNSLSYIRMVVSIEETFDIEFEDALLDYKEIKTIGEFIKVIDRQIV